MESVGGGGGLARVRKKIESCHLTEITLLFYLLTRFLKAHQLLQPVRVKDHKKINYVSCIPAEIHVHINAAKLGNKNVQVRKIYYSSAVLLPWMINLMWFEMNSSSNLIFCQVCIHAYICDYTL